VSGALLAKIFKGLSIARGLLFMQRVGPTQTFHKTRIIELKPGRAPGYFFADSLSSTSQSSEPAGEVLRFFIKVGLQCRLGFVRHQWLQAGRGYPAQHTERSRPFKEGPFMNGRPREPYGNARKSDRASNRADH
jgi:hypothetical protein